MLLEIDGRHGLQYGNQETFRVQDCLSGLLAQATSLAFNVLLAVGTASTPNWKTSPTDPMLYRLELLEIIERTVEWRGALGPVCNGDDSRQNLLYGTLYCATLRLAPPSSKIIPCSIHVYTLVSALGGVLLPLLDDHRLEVLALGHLALNVCNDGLEVWCVLSAC
jgi:hypothetical protein